MISFFKKHKFLSALALLAALLALTTAFAPWKTWLNARLIAMLEAQGLQEVRLTLSDVGLTQATLRDISIGHEAPLALQQLSVNYSLHDILHGELQELTVEGLHWDIRNTGESWNIAGIRSASEDTKDSAPLSAPVSRAALAAIPLERFRLENSRLQVTSPDWQMDVPVQVTWEASPAPRLTYSAPALEFKQQGLKISTGPATAEGTLDEANARWNGNWRIEHIAFDNEAFPLPEMEASGTLTVLADRAQLQGTLHSADNMYRAEFSMEYFWNDDAKSQFLLTSAILPWNDGTLSARDIRVPLAAPLPLNATLHVKHISVDTLLQSLTGDRASATGRVSGTLPMTISKDGDIAMHKGNLHSDEPGTILMQPDAIPGDNPQVTLVRDVLKNLHYSLLSITLDSGKDGDLSALLALEGNNPDVYNGRAVKLNVNLSGDVLDFVRQSLTTLTDPQQLLKQGTHAQP